jgi:hypothetical protein
MFGNLGWKYNLKEYVCLFVCVWERERDKVIMPIRFHVLNLIIYFYKRSEWICIIKMANLNLNMRPLKNYKKMLSSTKSCIFFKFVVQLTYKKEV